VPEDRSLAHSSREICRRRHDTAGELQYLESGELRGTVMTYGGTPVKYTLRAGDVGWAPRGFAHTYKCVSNVTCGLLVVWDNGAPATFDLGAWVRSSPVPVVAACLNTTNATVEMMDPSGDAILPLRNASELPWPLNQVPGLGRRLRIFNRA